MQNKTQMTVICMYSAISTNKNARNPNQQGMPSDSTGGDCWIFISNYCWLLKSRATMPWAWCYLLYRNSPKRRHWITKSNSQWVIGWGRGSPHSHWPGGSGPHPPPTPQLVGDRRPPLSPARSRYQLDIKIQLGITLPLVPFLYKSKQYQAGALDFKIRCNGLFFSVFCHFMQWKQSYFEVFISLQKNGQIFCDP